MNIIEWYSGLVFCGVDYKSVSLSPNNSGNIDQSQSLDLQIWDLTLDLDDLINYAPRGPVW